MISDCNRVQFTPNLIEGKESAISQIPQEILEHILSFVPVKMSEFSLTSKQFRLYYNENLFNYKLKGVFKRYHKNYSDSLDFIRGKIEGAKDKELSIAFQKLKDFVERREREIWKNLKVNSASYIANINKHKDRCIFSVEHSEFYREFKSFIELSQSRDLFLEENCPALINEILHPTPIIKIRDDNTRYSPPQDGGFKQPKWPPSDDFQSDKYNDMHDDLISARYNFMRKDLLESKLNNLENIVIQSAISKNRNLVIDMNKIDELSKIAMASLNWLDSSF